MTEYWSHTFDFTTSQHGWIPAPPYPARYINHVGWEPGDSAYVDTDQRFIRLEFPATHITGVAWTLDAAMTCDFNGWFYGIGTRIADGGTGYIQSGATKNAFSVSESTVTFIEIGNENCASSMPDATPMSGRITSVTLMGVGPNPFPQPTAEWTHTFDFSQGDFGWFAAPPYPATYVNGVGWEPGDVPYSNTDQRFIRREFPLARITGIAWTLDTAMNCDYRGWFYGIGERIWTGETRSIQSDETFNRFTFSECTVSFIELGNENCHPSTPDAIPMPGTIRSAMISGVGPNPFLDHDGAACEANFVGVDTEETS